MSYVLEVLDTLDEKHWMKMRPEGAAAPSSAELAATWGGKKARKKWAKQSDKGIDKMLKRAGVRDPDDD